MDGSPLARPLSMPLAFKAILVCFVIAGAAIGGTIFQRAYDDVILAPQREIDRIEQNLARVAAVQLPALPNLIQLDDEAVLATLGAEEYNLFDMNTVASHEGTGINLVKLPEGVSLVDASLAYNSGLQSLSSSEAIRMLNGSWTLTIGRDGYLDMRLRYADFRSENIEVAIQNALGSQGLAEAVVEEEGEDTAGNTYKTGVVSINDASYSWRVSACPLAEVYSIERLPHNTYYVGIRLYS
ncbi:MAG: teichoic acid transporter [Eggerthellaceae bacterium]|nr:teichoic acid transporter [Eggerthellaceae bacterium]